MPRLPSALLLVLLASGASAAERPWFEVTVEDGLTRCALRGPLADLIGSTPACAFDFDACPQAGATLLGEAEPLWAEALAPLIAREASGWAAACPGDGPRFLHQMALKALAYLGRTVDLDAVLALTAPAALATLGENPRRLVAQTLWWLGGAEHATAMARVAVQPASNPDFRPLALMALAEWRSRAAAPYCVTRLGPDADPRIAAACAHYLAAVDAPEARTRLEAALAHHPAAAVRALGLLKDKEAVPAVRRFAAKHRNTPRLRVPALVTLVELGEAEWLGRLVTALETPGKLRAKRLERARKRARKRPKKTRRRSWRRRKKKKKRPGSTRLSRRLMKEFAALELAHRVAMEVARITRPEHRARIDRALWRSARAVFPRRWQAHTYALLALAQRGDAEAVSHLVTLLGESVDPVRGAIIDAVGGLWAAPYAPGEQRGLGVVRDRRLLPALVAAANDADTFAGRKSALQAAMHIRTLCP